MLNTLKILSVYHWTKFYHIQGIKFRWNYSLFSVCISGHQDNCNNHIAEDTCKSAMLLIYAPPEEVCWSSNYVFDVDIYLKILYIYNHNFQYLLVWIFLFYVSKDCFTYNLLFVVLVNFFSKVKTIVCIYGLNLLWVIHNKWYQNEYVWLWISIIHI